VTLQPLRRFDVDAAIIFSDILVPVAKMGQSLSFGPGHGPILDPPIRNEEDAAALRRIDPSVDTAEVGETLQLVREALGDERAVIGFCGAPFTLLCYMVDGQGQKNFPETKKMIYCQPALAHQILGLLSDVLVDYLQMQIDAGADAVQVFDSWAGILAPEDFELFAAPYAAKVMAGVGHNEIPRIYFPRGIGAYLERVKSVPCEVVGIDWTQDLAKAADTLMPERAIQGNLDPMALLGSPESLEQRVKTLLKATEGRPGHIVNLGHGVIPQTDFEMGKRFVDLVHELGKG
jgi:uroporphyrinogen decarboxylase